MKRSQINQAYREASAYFKRRHWILPPNPAWDITDFGLGDFDETGLTLVNLADEAEYCEKLMYARKLQTTPAHAHLKKKEDIICRAGRLALRLWKAHPEKTPNDVFAIQVNRVERNITSGEVLILEAGERVTLMPGVYHEFWPESEECIIGEVSTANDDTSDNYFVNTEIGRYPGIEEDEPPLVRLLSE